MTVNIYLVNADGTGILVATTSFNTDADALAYISSLNTSTGNSYRAEQQESVAGARIIGSVP